MPKKNAVELILELHKKDGVVGLAKLPGLWKRRLNDRWCIWVNGHPNALQIEDSEQGAQGATVEPYDCFVEFNGWPAGFLSIPTGEGIIAAGSLANYDTFCEALQRAIDETPIPA